MFLHNRLHEITVKAYNESTGRATGGLTDKSNSTEIDLCVLWLPSKQSYRHTDKGTYILERAKIQVSGEELEDKNFEIITDKTHIVKDGNDYRIVDVKDASFMTTVQIKECILVKKIPKRRLY